MSLIPRMTMGERFGHATAGFGQNLVYNWLNLFLLAFLYEGLKLSSRGIATLTVVLTVVRIWDAVNDIAIGLLVDRTRTRWGTFRPYPLITALPIAVLTTLLFAIPEPADPSGETRSIILVAIAYLLWDLVYTASDVPYWSLTAVMTSDEDERAKTVSWARIGATIALALTVLFGPALTKAVGWTTSAAIVAFVGMALFTLAFFATKERVQHRPDPVPLREALGILGRNRPLQWLLLSMVIGFGTFVFQVGGAVLATVVFGDIANFTTLGAALIVGTLIGTIATPALLRHATAKRTLIVTNLVATVVYLVLWFIGARSVIQVAIGLAVAGVTMGITSVVTTRMVGDTADETEVRTGERTDGASFAGQTFTAKLNSAIATMAFGWAVAASGYEATATVTDGMKAGIWAACTIIPAISALLSVLPLLRYAVDEPTLSTRLAAVRAAKAASPEEGPAGADHAR